MGAEEAGTEQGRHPVTACFWELCVPSWLQVSGNPGQEGLLLNRLAGTSFPYQEAQSHICLPQTRALHNCGMDPVHSGTSK